MTPDRAEPDADFEAEKEAARRRILFLMEFWQITPEDLLRARKEPGRPAPLAPAAPRYRHPVSGATWDGIGSQPDWLREALLREGYTVEELRLPEGELQPPQLSA